MFVIYLMEDMKPSIHDKLSGRNLRFFLFKFHFILIQ
jgi:hypothetical protein